MCGKIKATVVFISSGSWSTDILIFYCSNVNQFLIDYDWWEPWNICLLLFLNDSAEVSLYKNNTGEQHWCVYYSWWVTDDNLNRKIKNRTLYRCRLFLLTWIFQYISSWSKVFQLLSTLFLRYTWSNKCWGK